MVGDIHTPDAIAVPIAPLNSVDEIVAGRFGNAFLNPPVSMDFPPELGINAGIIDGMFSFETGILDTCRRSYAQAIADLAALPSGKALLREVIIKCHENSMTRRNPQSVAFVNSGANNSRFTWVDNAECIIRLKWDGGSHVPDNWMLIVRNQTTGNLDLISVRVPPSIVLAHELGHFLYALETQVGTGGLHRRAQKRAHQEYDSIFNGVVSSTKISHNCAEKLFTDSWNGGNYVEVVNILPTTNMVPDINRSGYSDGVFIGEAVKNATVPFERIPHFFKLNGPAVDVHHDGVPAGRFVRFSHRSSEGFEADLNRLDANERSEFFKLIRILLQKIMIVTAENAEVIRPLRSKSKYLSLNDLPSID
ncbi:MAG: hypothetical protein LBB18_00560 [Puniceicoccales bacterium]|jgi:hypothetical protein|nr:hypothetical protein [Puniceicoccales bacterium]